MSRTSTRALLLAGALLVTPTVFAQSEEAEAGDTAEVAPEQVEPLRDRIRPVSGHVFLKRGRFEITPAANLSLKDAFFSKYIANLGLTYHLLEEVGIALRGGYAFNTVAGSGVICPLGGGCQAPTYAQLDGAAPGQINLLAGAELQYAPLYGKIALMAEAFLHFDMYALAGVSAVQYRAPNPNLTAGSTPEWAVGGTVGAGMRIFLSSWVTARLEVRDVIYQEIVAPRPTTSLRHQLLVELGVSFFIPTVFESQQERRP